MEKKHILPLAAASVFGITSIASAASNNCAPTPAATCYPDNCACSYCLGPDQVNPPVNPITCNGDVQITVAGFYWNAHQDGMEYAIDNAVVAPDDDPNTQADIQQLNNLIDAEYQTPNFKWDFGFKLGLAYAGCHDGWDVGLLWTWYKGK